MDRATPCPLCNGSRNHTSHYTECNLIKPLWIRLADLLDMPPLTTPQILLGRDLELGACHFVTILRKFIIGCIFSGDNHPDDLEKRLWTQACRTFADRALALQFRIFGILNSALASEKQPQPTNPSNIGLHHTQAIQNAFPRSRMSIRTVTLGGPICSLLNCLRAN